MTKTSYKVVLESFKSYDPELNVEIDNAEEKYEKVPDEFVEYKYNDKLADVRKDIDYFKTRLDESESEEARQKYLKIINDLIEEEKRLICVTTTTEKHDLDKKDYVAKQVIAKV